MAVFGFAQKPDKFGAGSFRFGAAPIKGGGAWTPSRIRDDIVRWWDFRAGADRTDISGAVASIASLAAGPQSLKPVVLQATSGNRPAASDDFVTFDGTNDILVEADGVAALTYISSTTLPDVSTSTTGKGFVCTGAARVPSSGKFWVGNHGWPDTGSGASAQPGIIRLNSDFTLDLEVKVSDLGFSAANSSIQGVCIDPRDESVWALRTVTENRLIHISAAGALLGSFVWSGNALNGLGWDSVQNQLVGCEASNPVLHWIDPTTGEATGQTLTLPTPAQAYDQIAVDAARDLVVATFGSNGGSGNLSLIEISTGRLISNNLVSTQSTAIEGVTWDDAGNLWIFNDIFYHNATGTNLVAICTIAWPSLRTLGQRFMLGGIFRRTGTNAASSALMALGDILAGAPGKAVFGIFHPSSTTDTISLVIGDGTLSSSVVANVDVDTNHIVLFDVDLPNQTVTPYIDGVAGTPSTGLKIPATQYSNRKWALGGIQADATPSRWSKSEARAALAVRHAGDASERQVIEGYLAWEYGLTTLLTWDHPYKSARP